MGESLLIGNVSTGRRRETTCAAARLQGALPNIYSQNTMTDDTLHRRF